jgi:hypothetical protein
MIKGQHVETSREPDLKAALAVCEIEKLRVLINGHLLNVIVINLN